MLVYLLTVIFIFSSRQFTIVATLRRKTLHIVKFQGTFWTAEDRTEILHSGGDSFSRPINTFQKWDFSAFSKYCEGYDVLGCSIIFICLRASMFFPLWEKVTHKAFLASGGLARNRLVRCRRRRLSRGQIMLALRQ